MSEVPVETSPSPALRTAGGTPQGFHRPHWLEVTKRSFQSLPSHTPLPAMLLARAGGSCHGHPMPDSGRGVMPISFLHGPLAPLPHAQLPSIPTSSPRPRANQRLGMVAPSQRLSDDRTAMCRNEFWATAAFSSLLETFSILNACRQFLN